MWPSAVVGEDLLGRGAPQVLLPVPLVAVMLWTKEQRAFAVEPSFPMVGRSLQPNEHSVRALKFVLTEPFLFGIRLCHGLPHFRRVDVSPETELDLKGPPEPRKMLTE